MAISNAKNLIPSQKQASIASQVLSQWGARLGLLWIGLLGFFAIFAPFLANSHPLLLSQKGQISSPILYNFTSTDTVLITLFIVGFILIIIKSSLRTWLWILSITCVLSGVLSSWLLHPPTLTIYEQYREQESIGKYEWVIHTPIPYSPKDYQRDKDELGLQPPNQNHWLGTEENGADVLSRMIYASRVSLGIGFVATSIAMVLGIVIGGLMGYFSGIVDMIGMRLIEIFEAVPTLFLLLTFVAFFERSLYMLMVIIGITSWPGYARYVRAEFLRLRQQDFVQAAIACGLPLHSILFRHMLPNGIGPILVSASFGIASAILAEAVLSFLGLGLVDDPSWGQMLNQAVKSSMFNWWMAVFPGGAIFLTVFSYNLIGESLRDILDPYLKKPL
ncbi:ABC transporter permease [Candidatus Nitrosacidococcus tergens]|uniref:Binding-protein-dependent transport systems inner membrane component n=1 Tax=Candidatus Nitrosacidococcus tergens TaxID=553981 RepID=A0A7G1QBS9_9GAMM|nr:ABC transporter permease [Candidatus Nitrosacidococcus tergens]CAB1277432.1 Binding-protein-dependent transport systems inner membrane component [Candidatus Nitrosacidococcus tergens]